MEDRKKESPHNSLAFYSCLFIRCFVALVSSLFFLPVLLNLLYV